MLLRFLPSLQILPRLAQLSPNLHNDIMVFNAGWVGWGRVGTYAGASGLLPPHMHGPSYLACLPGWLAGSSE